MVRFTLDSIPEDTNRFKREEGFSEEVSDYYIEEMDSWDERKNQPNYMLVFETENEPHLKIKLGYEKWEEHDGELHPKPKSTFYEFLYSFLKLGVEVDMDVPTKTVQFYPEIKGKRVAFKVDHRSFPSKNPEDIEIGEDGKERPKIIAFDAWTVEAIGNGQMTIPIAEPTKPTPTAEPEIEMDKDVVDSVYFDILNRFGTEKFSLANVIGATNKYLLENPDTPYKNEYTNASKRVKYLADFVSKGLLVKTEDGFYQNV